MIQLLALLYLVVLFYIFTPNVLLRIPPTGSKAVVALVHGVLFGLVYLYTAGYVNTLLTTYL